MDKPSTPGPRLLSLRESFWILASAALPLALSLRAIREPDLGWHLAVGRHVQTRGELPWTNLWSFTTPEHPFAATSWLYGWAMYGLERLGGWEAISLATGLFVAAAFALAYVTARLEGAGRGLALAATWAGAAASHFRFVPRPHVVSFLLLALTLFVLLHVRRTRQARPLIAVPLIVAFWSNVHAGSVFGAAAAGCFFAAEFIEALLSRDRPLPRRWLLQCAACAGVTCLALLANPYGLEIARYTFFHLGDVDQVIQLEEFLPPTLAREPGFWLVLPFIPLALAAGRRRDVFAWLLLLAFGVGAMKVVRLVPKALLVLLPLAAAAAQVAARRAAERWPPLARLGTHRLGRAGGWALAGLAPLGVLAVDPLPLVGFAERLHVGINVYNFPEKMARFVEERGIRGRCFASWDVSGYAIWRFPESPVFIDARLRAYPTALFHELKKSDSDQATFDALMERYDTEWAFRGHTNLGLSGIGRFSRDRWAVIYWDEAGQVMVRRDIERFAPLVRELEFKKFLPGAKVMAEFRSLRGEDRALWFAELRRVAQHSPRALDAQLGLCLEHARTGALAEAAAACELAVVALDDRRLYLPQTVERRVDDVANAITYLGQRTLRTGNADAARADFQRALALHPTNPGALVALGMLELKARPGEARKLFEQALEANATFAPALKGLAQALTALGETQEAERVRARLPATASSSTEP